jgi:hypothetical protein
MDVPKENCPVCNGLAGFINGKPSKDINSASWVRCRKCKGRGQLDWVEMVMGVKGTFVKPGVYVQEVDYSVVIKTGEEMEWMIT